MNSLDDVWIVDSCATKRDYSTVHYSTVGEDCSLKTNDGYCTR